MAVTGLLAAALLSASPAWAFVGVTEAGLRVFVDRASIADHAAPAGGVLRRVAVRLGSPGTIVGSIVEVVQGEEIDCAAGRWRLLDYAAYDDAGAVVQHRAAPDPAMPLVAFAAGSLGATIRDAVCDGRAAAGVAR